jgi:hypothetical protein
MAGVDQVSDNGINPDKNNFKPGDTVQHHRYPEDYFTVLAVDGGWLWLRPINGDDSPLPVTMRSYLVTKVEPFFEVGKTYRSTGGTGTFIPTYINTDEDGTKVALGRTDLGRWACRRQFDLWKEVTE